MATSERDERIGIYSCATGRIPYVDDAHTTTLYAWRQLVDKPIIYKPWFFNTSIRIIRRFHRIGWSRSMAYNMGMDKVVRACTKSSHRNRF